MLDTAAVAELARPVVEKALAPLSLSDLRVQETADSEGHDALDILAVTDRLADDAIDSEINASIALQHALQTAGETRYAFFRFTTIEALTEAEEDGDDE